MDLVRPRPAADTITTEARTRLDTIRAEFVEADQAAAKKIAELSAQLTELHRNRTMLDREVMQLVQELERAETAALLGEDVNVPAIEKRLAAARKRQADAEKSIRLLSNAMKVQNEGRAKILAPLVVQLQADIMDDVAQPVVVALAALVRAVAGANDLLTEAKDLEANMVDRVRDQQVPLVLTRGRDVPRFGSVVQQHSGYWGHVSVSASDAELFIREAREAGYDVPEA